VFLCAERHHASKEELVKHIALGGALVAGLASTAQADQISSGVSLEFSYVFGSRSYNLSSFRQTGGDTAATVLEGTGLRGAAVAGVGVDLRIAANGFRFSIGYTKPYVQGVIRIADPSMTDTVSAMKVRGVDAGETQFGLGFEYDLEAVALFADLVGTADMVDADIVVGEAQGTYRCPAPA
jgi:hypothetical protein